MSSIYYDNLIKTVLDYSNSKNWGQAVREWEVVDCEEDDSQESSCICGKENLRYLFTIENIKNGNALYPIGSVCIHKFERSDLNDVVSINEGLFKLLHAIENNEYLTLTSDYFSRKLLKYLFDNDVFQPSKYNNFNPENDYDFLLDMFNKKDKTTITDNQYSKIGAIMVSEIKPYLQSILRGKIRR